MTSPDLSRYPLWMMQCLSTAIIQRLQLNSEYCLWGSELIARNLAGVTPNDGRVGHQRTKVPINFSGALGELRAGCMGTVLLGTQSIPSCAHKVQMLDNVPPCGRPRQSPVWMQGHERQLGMTSPDLSRYPLWMMQCLSTALIQRLQLNSESLVLGVGAHSPQPPGGDTKWWTGWPQQSSNVLRSQSTFQMLWANSELGAWAPCFLEHRASQADNVPPCGRPRQSPLWTQGHERQLGMTSPDLSRYPLWMMQCLSTAIIQHLQLNSEYCLWGSELIARNLPGWHQRWTGWPQQSSNVLRSQSTFRCSGRIQSWVPEHRDSHGASWNTEDPKLCS